MTGLRRPEVRIGVAIDEAFNFYYADLFDILRTFGAETVPFSPVHDRLPAADGYIIGGGYPELFVSELEANDRMREGIRETSRNGVPVYAECGGLMYLTGRMTLKKGWQGRKEEQSSEMCGVFAGETSDAGKAGCQLRGRHERSRFPGWECAVPGARVSLF